MGILNNVAIQWLIRRVPEWGGLIALIIGTIALAPPDVGTTITAILTGKGGGLTVTAYFGLVSWVYAQIISYRATVRQQVVQSVNGSIVTTPLKEVSASAETQVKAAIPAPRKRTLIDVLIGK